MTLYMQESYSAPKLVAEDNIIRSQTPPFPIICSRNLKTPPKADDVICERPLLPKLSTKTGRNQKKSASKGGGKKVIIWRPPPP